MSFLLHHRIEKCEDYICGDKDGVLFAYQKKTTYIFEYIINDSVISI